MIEENMNFNGEHLNDVPPILSDKANEYLRECLAEKKRMDKKFPFAEKLIECEIERVQTTGRIQQFRDPKYADIYREKPLRLSQKVLVPIREHPKFNFVGKLLGPKGNSMKRLQEETLCKMTVLGRNSMRDRAKEEELRSSLDPKYGHLNSDLHVEISTIAPPAEAYARIAYAMAELRKYLIPDSNDGIRQEQLRELMDNTSISSGGCGNSSSGIGGAPDNEPKVYKKPQQYHQHQLSAGGLGPHGPNKFNHHGYRQQSQQQQPSFANNSSNNNQKNSAMPKQKVMSILEKARSAMEETYNRVYDDHSAFEHQPFDHSNYGHSYSHQHVQQAPPSNQPTHGPSHGLPLAHALTQAARGIGPFDSAPEYDNDYRRDYYPHSPNYALGGNTGPHGPPPLHGVNTNQTGNINLNPNRSHVNR